MSGHIHKDYTGANLIVLHVMEEASPSAQRQVQMAFGENLYKEIRAKHKTGAQDLLIGKNVDAVRIRQAIAGFFEDRGKTPADADSPIKKILVAEGHSIADEIVSTAVEEDCAFIARTARENNQAILLLRDFFLGSRRGNVWAKLRINSWQNLEDGQFHLKVVRGLSPRELSVNLDEWGMAT